MTDLRKPDPAIAAAEIAEGLARMFQWTGVPGEEIRVNEGAQMLANGIEEALRFLDPDKPGPELDTEDGTE